MAKRPKNLLIFLLIAGLVMPACAGMSINKNVSQTEAKMAEVEKQNKKPCWTFEELIPNPIWTLGILRHVRPGW